MINKEIKKSNKRGKNNIIIEKTSGPGEKNAENTESIIVASLHRLIKKEDFMIPILPSKMRTIGIWKLIPNTRWILKNIS
jgi:hypothetical protein